MLTKSDGQSLFEVVVALAISALVVISIVSLATNAVRNSTFSKNKSIASSYAQQLVEWLRGQRDQNITQFISYVSPSGSATSWCFPDLKWDKHSPCGGGDKIGTIFLRQANFTTDASGKIFRAEVVISWQDSQGEHKVVNSTDLSDWR